MAPTVTFNTANVTVNLLNHSGQPITDQNGTVDYYANGWKSFGAVDANGTVSKELLPLNYTFGMNYLGGRQEKGGAAPTVTFQTGQVSGSATHYYANGWKTFTSSGMQLLPLKYTFRLSNGTEKSYTIIAGTTNTIP